MKKITFVFALAFSFWLPTQAQQNQQNIGEANARLFAQGACPSYFDGMNRQPILAEALKKRNISSQAVCACISEKITSDQKLVLALSVDDAKVKALFRSKKFESYLMTRLMHSGLVCLAPELEAALDSDSPEN